MDESTEEWKETLQAIFPRWHKDNDERMEWKKESPMNEQEEEDDKKKKLFFHFSFPSIEDLRFLIILLFLTILDFQFLS